MTTPACITSHLGVYACDPKYLQGMLAGVRAGTLPMRAAADIEDAETARGPGYAIESGVAIIRVDGGLTKGFSKFGGTSATFTRRAVRAAVADPKVGAILVKVYSPGGQVDGIDDLARAVAAAAAVKPTESYIEDLGASAGYWIASQGEKVWANPGAIVGSIGVFAVLIDSSKAAEMEGLRVIPVTTGGTKGDGQPGVPISDEAVENFQGVVDAIGARFFGAVKKARGMSQAQLDAATTGGIWPSGEAKAMGLVDGIKSFDEVLAGLAAKAARTARPRASAGEARARLADLE